MGGRLTSALHEVAPILVFGWGNPSRGDDALGPLLIEQLTSLVGEATAGQLDLLTDFQLQVEHALDLRGRQQVLFVDASVRAGAPFEVSTLHADRDVSFTTHAMSPQALMHVYEQLEGGVAPPCTLLAIRAQRFELGEPPSDEALNHLSSALLWCQAWLSARLSVKITAKIQPCPTTLP